MKRCNPLASQIGKLRSKKVSQFNGSELPQNAKRSIPPAKAGVKDENRFEFFKIAKCAGIVSKLLPYPYINEYGPRAQFSKVNNIEQKIAKNISAL